MRGRWQRYVQLLRLAHLLHQLAQAKAAGSKVEDDGSQPAFFQRSPARNTRRYLPENLFTLLPHLLHTILPVQRRQNLRARGFARAQTFPAWGWAIARRKIE